LPPDPDAQHAEILHAKDHALICYEQHCVELDPSGRIVATLNRPEQHVGAPAADALTTRWTGRKLAVCRAKHCTELDPGYGKQAPVAQFADDAGARVFAVARDGGKLVGDVYDVATNRRTARIPLPGLEAGNDMAIEGSFYGTDVLLYNYVSSGPGDHYVVQLATRKLRQLYNDTGGDLIYSKDYWIVLQDARVIWIDRKTLTDVFAVSAPEHDGPSWFGGTAIGGLAGKTILAYVNPMGFTLIDDASHTALPPRLVGCDHRR
jgi:hypothetical protein